MIEWLWGIMGDDLLALQIAMPLLTATICVIVRRPLLAWAVAGACVVVLALVLSRRVSMKTAVPFGPALIAAGEGAFRQCQTCHQVGDGAKNRTGPDRRALFGRTAGTHEGFRYSPAFVAAGAAPAAGGAAPSKEPPTAGMRLMVCARDPGHPPVIGWRAAACRAFTRASS